MGNCGSAEIHQQKTHSERIEEEIEHAQEVESIQMLLLGTFKYLTFIVIIT